jgi:AAA15 family ATPase/GTPase
MNKINFIIGKNGVGKSTFLKAIEKFKTGLILEKDKTLYNGIRTEQEPIIKFKI